MAQLIAGQQARIGKNDTQWSGVAPNAPGVAASRRHRVDAT